MNKDIIRKEEILKALTIDDMPNADMRLVAEFCGVDIAIKLLEELPGIGINVPTNGFKKVLEKYACEHNDGTGDTVKRIALIFNVSERHIYKLCAKKEETTTQEELFKEG